jgi:hypothetical protein
MDVLKGIQKGYGGDCGAVRLIANLAWCNRFSIAFYYRACNDSGVGLFILQVIEFAACIPFLVGLGYVIWGLVGEAIFEALQLFLCKRE